MHASKKKAPTLENYKDWGSKFPEFRLFNGINNRFEGIDVTDRKF